MPRRHRTAPWKALLLIAVVGMAGCSDDSNPVSGENRVYEVALGCYSLAMQDPGESGFQYITVSSDGSAFVTDGADPLMASRFRLKPADLATYLLYDRGGFYLTADDAGALQRQDELLSDIMLVQDGFLPGAQWVLETSEREPDLFQIRHLKSGHYLSRTGLKDTAAAAAVVMLEEHGDCAEHPELSLDAEGEPVKVAWEDGTVYGFAEPHTHLFTNFGFGGGGIFHGSPYHPLGVEHALVSCERYHGEGGRKDFLGLGVSDQGDVSNLINLILQGEASEDFHVTTGYPDFTDWPDGPREKTHQTQYYQWVKRAYLGGLRLMVQHGTSYEILCELISGSGISDVRYSCNDMVAIDRQIEETYKLERYIDAHEGGPGKGWFRIVTTPEEARAVIADGKMAVVLGIEVSNLFDCFLNPRNGEDRCYPSDVIAALDEYEAKGVRVLFPNHKTDNLFTPGDGSKGIFELANFVQTGNYSNFIEDDCPSVGRSFDDGALQFGNLNRPREDYLAAPSVDFSDFPADPIGNVLPFLLDLLPTRIEGDFCKKTGLTDIGEFLILEMMRRGLIVELDHLPKKSYEEVYRLLELHNYPAIGTHGGNNNGKLYELGGMSVSWFGRCDPDGPSRERGRNERNAMIEAQGFLGAEPMSFDMNGLASPPRGRFDPDRPCNNPQDNPVTHPFTSYAGDVTFTQPVMGNRTIDFNTEGFVHLGMYPEMIEDFQRSGISQEAMDDLFRSAEAYLQLWERSLQRAQEIREAQM